MSISFQAAAKGTPEMAFWPTAASVIVYSENPTSTNLLVIFEMMLVGSMTYLGMRQVKSFLKELERKSSKRRRVTRNNDAVIFRKLIPVATDTARAVLPDKRPIFAFVAICILLNTASGVLFLAFLMNRITTSPDPNPALVGLAALPLLYVFVIASIFIWNH